MRIIALASALLLLGATAALAQSSNSDSGSSSSGSSRNSGAAAAATAAAGAHANISTQSVNPLQGATAGTPSVSAPVPLNQFQPPVIDIQLSDSVTLPLFGTQLFSGSFAGSRPADRPDYLIQPGDQVVINLYGAVNTGGVQTVDAGGNVFVVGVGPIRVGGTAATKLQSVVSTAVGRVFTGAVSVYATVNNAGTIGVFVSGDVFKPGRYLGATHDSVLFFLNQANWIAANGTYRNVTVRRGGQIVANFDLYDFLLSGNAPSFRFEDGDVIFVGPRGPVVGADGGVRASFAFEAPPNAQQMTGADIIRMARPEPTVSGVVVTGYRNGAPRQAYFTLEDFARVVLSDGDHVRFAYSGYAQSMTVTIQGEVTGPRVYVLGRGAELSELLAKIPLAGTDVEPRWVHVQRPSVAVEQKKAIDDELYNLQKQVLTSSPPTNSAAQLATAQATLISQFVAQAANVKTDGNIAVYTNGQFHDLRLQEGDVVILPNRTDVVLVSGEVLSPGGLAHVDNMRIEDYVARAGGYAAHADRRRFVLRHPDGSGVVAMPNTRPQAGDQILVLPTVGNEKLQIFMDLSQLFFQLALSAATVISVSHNV